MTMVVTWRTKCGQPGESSTELQAHIDLGLHYESCDRCDAETAVGEAQPPTERVALVRPPAAVLGDLGLTVVLLEGALAHPGGSSKPLGEPLEHVGRLVALCGSTVSTVMVSAGAAGWVGLPATVPDDLLSCAFFHMAIAAGFTLDVAGAWQVRVKRPEGGRSVAVVLLGYDVDGYVAPWSTCTDELLVDGLAEFRYAVGASFGSSIGQTADRLLLATHPREKGGARLQRSVMPAVLEEVAEPAALWRRPLDVDKLATATHVHWYDANANYLGAYQTAELGRGEPSHHYADDRFMLVTYPGPALMRAQLPAELAREGDMPVPWSTSAQWHTTPTIVRARDLGVDVDALVTESWSWPLKSRYCQPFGERMRDARATLLEETSPATSVAAAAVGKIYQRLHGRFAAGFRADGTSLLWRPDWYQTIRAQARCNLDRRMAQLAAAPFCVDTDCAYFLADVVDPVEYATAIEDPDRPLLGPRSKVGAFRVAGTVKLTDELRRELARVTTAAGTRELLRAAAQGAAIPAKSADEIGGHVDAAIADLEPAADLEDDLAELAELLRGGE